jgi:transposase
VNPLPEILLEIRKCSKKLQIYFKEILLENEQLRAEIAKLRARINANSTNSSRPPSANPFLKPKSLRIKTGRKPGGQPGHKGATLQVRQTPDVVIKHEIDTCSHCGCDISMQAATLKQTRQVLDVQITPVVTEHCIMSKTCMVCGKESTAKFPQGVGHYIQYGDTYSSIIVCLNKGNYIPYERLSNISKDIFGIAVSSGTLVNIIHKCGKSLDDSIDYIKDQLKQANVVCFDETGNRVKKQNRWLHSASNEKYTYIKTHAKRGSDATDDIGILPEFKGTAVHDFWKSYYNYPGCRHALCNAHILRELNGISENFAHAWPDKMKMLLLDIKQNVDAAKGALNLSETIAYEVRYDKILESGEKENSAKDALKRRGKRGRIAKSKASNLLERMKKYKKDILKFMTDTQVPFDNNLAERDIRMSKLQQKISGGFRSDEGSQAFDNIRSYISTATKHEISMFESIYSAISGNPLFAGDTS